MKQKNYIWMLFISLLASVNTFGQQGVVSGVVTDDGEPLIGATIKIKGTDVGTVTDFNGNYQFSLDPGAYTLNASYVGYIAQNQIAVIESGKTTTLNFDLENGLNLSEVVILGSRNPARTKAKSAVPVDVINVADLGLAAPQTELNQMLHYSTPSFNSNTQTISDGTDHIDPASLRGLGPDQVLVLINGKRRHTTSLVNVNGTFGRGNVGTDLNAIPSTAISNVQVLRDGAAAQYGSDAIAGVINLQLRKEVNKLSANYSTGANFTAADRLGAFGGEKKKYDGETAKIGLNYGLPIGDKGGYINMTGDFSFRNYTNRMTEYRGSIFNRLNAIERVAKNNGYTNLDNLTMADAQQFAQQVSYFSQELKDQISGAADMAALQSILGEDATEDELNARGLTRSDFNMRVGQSALRQGQFFANMAVPLSENLEVYAFGGAGYRNGNSGCFYRLPNQSRTPTSIYLNGTVPIINSNIIDRSIAAGLRGEIGDWNLDFSNTFGSNVFAYRLTNAMNATLESSSPTSFNNGGHGFSQNTSNFDISRYFDGWMGTKGVNFAFGGEYRLENYNIFTGTEVSYGNYTINGELVTPTTPSSELERDFLGRTRPAGCQCFSGFQPSNIINAYRSSVAGYADAELDITEALLVEGAIRYENYTDFGNTFNYKLAGRYSIGDFLNLRAAYSTGFRAPSLHQIHFSRTSTIFETINGQTVASEVGLFANTSRAAKLLGIPELKQETSNNISGGFALSMRNLGLTLTVDGYVVNIKDRVILTGTFNPGDANSDDAKAELTEIFNQAQAGKAAFFANAIDTKSTGLDVVLSHKYRISDNMLMTTDLAGTFSRTRQVGDVKASDLLKSSGLVNKFFDQQARVYLEAAIPTTKITLGNSLEMGKVNIYLRNTYFGRTLEATNEPIYDEDLNPIPTDQLDAKYKDVDPVYSPKVVTDLSVGYQISDKLSLTVGSNNLLDIYPDYASSIFQSSGRFLYSRRSPQYSLNGRYVFARINFTLDGE